MVPPPQEYKTSLASLLEVAQPPVIKDYLLDQGVATGTGIDFRPKQVKSFELFKPSQNAQHYGKYGMKAKPLHKPRGGGFRLDTASNSTMSTQALTTEDSQSGKKTTMGALLFRATQRPVSGVVKLSMPDEDVIKEDYVLENFEPRTQQKGPGVVSDKFLQFLVHTGIPIASIGGQPVELPQEYKQMQEDIRANNYSGISVAFQNQHLRNVSNASDLFPNKDLP